MQPLVIYQHVFLSETRVALVAGKRLLSGVNPSCKKKTKPESAHQHRPAGFSKLLPLLPAVHLKRRILGKLGAAFGALVRLGACVRSLVHLQRRLGAERFAAPGADVPQVAAFVDLRGGEMQLTQSKQKFTTNLWSLLNSCRQAPPPHLSLMADDVLLPLKGLHAGVTGEEPLAAVDVFLVDLQVAAIGERLLAGLAAVDDVGLDSVVGARQDRRTDR